MESTFNLVLNHRPDPLDVLKTTAYVVENSRHVTINYDAVERAADALVEKKIEPPAWNYDYHYHDGTARTVNYLFLLDTLNFCFWGKPKWGIDYNGKHLDGYWALAAALKRAIQKDSRIAEGDFLARISPQELADTLCVSGTGTIPLFTERWRNTRELGTVLKNLWEGEAARLVECAGHSAPHLAQMVAENFASFNDIAVYDNHEVRLFKRAQIVVTDIWGAFKGKDWGEFEDIDQLTAFADYKLPQILRAWSILKYAPTLARKVDAQIEIAAGSPDETEIRAAMLWGVEFLREALAKRGRQLWSIQVDWILWEASQGKFEGMKPYHRVRTIYY
ncbi:MAG: hypothetical protein HZB51_33670 [Chloroflexi bacterium]|nr:hypothetical protein [Chloroflexota bacterium]